MSIHRTIPTDAAITNTSPPLDKLSLKDRFWHQKLRRPYRLHVYDHGAPAPDSPVIVLLHGLASSSANWDTLIPLLSQHYRCISLDLLGFGDSPRPQWPDYSMEDHLKSIQATIHRLRLKAPFTLVGHSLGSLLATRYARQHPQRVRRLILLSPPVYDTPRASTSRAARKRTSLYLSAYRFVTTHKRITYDNFSRLSRILPLAKFLILDAASWKPFIRSLQQCIANQTLVSDIRHVKAPVDIFYGAFDEVIVPYNIKQLATIHELRLHPLRVNHVVGTRYAAAVAKTLKTTPDTTNSTA